MLAIRVVVCPVDNSTFGIPLIFSEELYIISHTQTAEAWSVKVSDPDDSEMKSER